jgi:tetratricopeptide (TPR) repeat protein
METEMNQALMDMTDFTFKRMVDNLVDRRLISKTKDNTFAMHPLIKNYFESIFDEDDKKLCHKRIYQYIGEYAPEWPGTLEEMQPLFEQVYHGCAAGLYDEVDSNILEKKIDRGNEIYLVSVLGAWETELSLERAFFPKGDFSQMPLVSTRRDQGWHLNEAGVALLATGRPKEAEELLVRKTNMQVEDKDWENAFAGYHNLADLQFRTGEPVSGLNSAKKAIDASEKAEDDYGIWISKAEVGWIFYLLGESKEAEKTFNQADEICIEYENNRLRNMPGV